MSWADQAKLVIWTVDHALPAGVSFKDRKAAIDGAYPFGVRAHHPYKAWLKVRKAYLGPYDPTTSAPLFDAPPKEGEPEH